MHEAEHAVAVLHRGDEDAHREEVVDVAHLLPLRGVRLRLAVDAVDVLGAPGHLGVEARVGEFVPQHAGHLLDVRLPLRALGGEQGGDAAVLVRLDVAEGEVLQLPLDLAHAEAVREGGVDVQRLLRDGDAPVRRQRAERLHVVQPVRQFDEHDADVVRHRDEHLAQALRLAVALGDERHGTAGDGVHARELGDAVGQFRHVLAELLAEVVQADVAVFENVVEERRGDGRRVEAEVGQVLGDGDGVLDVVLAGLALLPLVGGGGEIERPFNHLGSIAGQVAAHFVEKVRHTGIIML